MHHSMVSVLSRVEDADRRQLTSSVAALSVAADDMMDGYRICWLISVGESAGSVFRRLV